jgi:hypothetical protein
MGLVVETRDLQGYLMGLVVETREISRVDLRTHSHSSGLFIYKQEVVSWLTFEPTHTVLG